MIAPVTVQPVRSRQDRRRFIGLPYTLYRNEANWIPPLRSDQAALLNPRKNPFYGHGLVEPFLALDAASRIVGRVAGIINGMHLKKYEDGVGFFGLFECVERYDVARALFDAVASWLRRHGLARMRGPTNLTINESSGLLIHGFDRRPFVMMPYNPPYYEAYLIRYGFQALMSMKAYQITAKRLNADRLQRGTQLVMRRNDGISLRKLDTSSYREEVKRLHVLYNEAFAEGWGSVPMTEAEFNHAASNMKRILDPHLIFFLEHNKRPIGFSLSLPNINRWLRLVPDGRLFPFGLLKLLFLSRFRAVDEMRTVIFGLLPAYQRRGLDTLLIWATIEEGLRRGYTAAELSWVMDDNPVMKNMVLSIGGVLDKEYGMYEVSL